MAKCKVEYREPVFILELNSSERSVLIDLLRCGLSEKHRPSDILRDLTNINTALHTGDPKDG